MKSNPRRALWLGPCLFCLSLPAHGRTSKTEAIDNLCLGIRNEFVEASPSYFSGPDPWVKVEEPPDPFADAALAGVYREGARVRWVVLEIVGPNNAWFETIDYFFDEAGSIQKRERYLEQSAANVRVEEFTYFRKARILTTRYRHSAIRHENRQKENWDIFFDPNAPEYISTADLPLCFEEFAMRQFGLRETPGVCVPAVLKPFRKDLHPC